MPVKGTILPRVLSLSSSPLKPNDEEEKNEPHIEQQYQIHELLPVQRH